MNKPLRFYTSYVSGDDSYLFDLQKDWGCALQKLSRREQLFMLSNLATYLGCIEPGEVRSEVIVSSACAQSRLDNRDIEGLCEALINQIRWGCHEQIHNT